jgi:hypothetical protein
VATISTELQNAVRCAPIRQYRLAQKINVHPSTLSGWLNRIAPVKRGDRRVLELARLLGIGENAAFAPHEDDKVTPR